MLLKNIINLQYIEGLVNIYAVLVSFGDYCYVHAHTLSSVEIQLIYIVCIFVK